MSHCTHMSESCRTYEWVMPHRCGWRSSRAVRQWLLVRKNAGSIWCVCVRTLECLQIHTHNMHALLLWVLCHTATRCNTLQHTATHCNTQRHTHNMPALLLWVLCHTATHCNTPQHTATRRDIHIIYTLFCCESCATSHGSLNWFKAHLSYRLAASFKVIWVLSIVIICIHIICTLCGRL